MPDKSKQPDTRPAIMPLQQTEEATFAEPWEGQAFAAAVALRERAVLRWPDFVSYLSDEISSAEAAGRDTVYYLHWLQAMERLLLDRGLVTAEELSRRCAELAAARRRDHDRDHEDRR